MNAVQTAIQATAHNIANAATPGYTRQYAVVEPNTPLSTPNGVIGTGVRVVNIARARDLLLDTRFREESSSLGASARRGQQLQQLEALYNEPSDQGLRATLDRFWSAWSDPPRRAPSCRRAATR
jgi:flagellar hook-associated protein 1 FlgK